MNKAEIMELLGVRAADFEWGKFAHSITWKEAEKLNHPVAQKLKAMMKSLERNHLRSWEALEGMRDLARLRAGNLRNERDPSVELKIQDCFARGFRF